MFGVVATAAVTVVAVAGATLASRRLKLSRERAKAAEQARFAEQALEQHRLGAIAEAKERAEALRTSLTTEFEAAEEALAADQERLKRVEAKLLRRNGLQEEREAELKARFESVNHRREQVRQLKIEVVSTEGQIDEAIERAARTTRKEVVSSLIASLSDEARLAVAKISRNREEAIHSRAEAEARSLMDLSCQRYGVPPEVQRLASTVELPKDAGLRQALLADGRAVLQALHEHTQVEFQESGEDLLYLQARDPFTREVGRLTYDRLIRLGSLNGGVVEKLAAKAAIDLEKMARDAGNRAAKILKIKKIHPELLFLVGKLLYRTSYTQNQWQHALETAQLCGMMAQDLGMDVRLAQRAALLHDIGKVLWEETEQVGSHAVSGANFAREHGEPPEVVHPIAAHHGDEKPATPLAHLVAAADALSGGRPGARRETLEAYTRRVDDLDRICSEFEDVKRAYVIQGGREVRIEVDARRMDDRGTIELAESVAHRIEDECVYPGQIKVTILREVRCSAMAR